MWRDGRRWAPHRSERARGRGQGGITLIETLVALAVIGIVVVSGLSGLFTMIVASDTNDDRARLEAGLTAYVESLKQLPTYVACPSTASAAANAYNAAYTGSTWQAPQRWEPATGGPLSGATIRVTDVAFWNGTTFGSTCGTNTAQQLTVEIVWGDRDISGVLVKRKP